MALASRLAADYPSTRIVVEHTGMPLGLDRTSFDTWRAGLRLLAAQENTVLKLGGLAMVNHDWQPETISPFLSEAVEIYGATRCMWSSNLPVEKLFGPAAQLLDVYRAALSQCDPAELSTIFSGTAASIYNIAVSAPR